MSTNSLYGQTTNPGNVPAEDFTTLYSGPGIPNPNASGDLVLFGNLAVNGGNITTTATNATIFNTNATTVDAFGAATSISIGSGTGGTSINNNLIVGGDQGVNGSQTVGGNQTVVGNSQIDGSLEVGNSAYIQGNNLYLNYNSVARDVLLNFGTGIGNPNKTLKWNSAQGYFEFSNAVVAPSGVFGNISIAPSTFDNLITTISGDLQLKPATKKIEVSQGGTITWDEANNRLNRLSFQSSTGNTTGTRLLAPNNGGTALSTFSLFNTSDANNGNIFNMQARGSSLTDPFIFATGTYTGGVSGPSGEKISIFDGTTKYATLNPAGVVDGTDLTTKTYVDTAIAGLTTNKLVNGAYQDVLNADGSTTFAGDFNLAQATGFLYDESNNRLNRPYFQSTTGNSSGLRVSAPNATTSASASLTVSNTNDIQNSKFLTVSTSGSTTTPFGIVTGQRTAGVLSATGNSISIADATTVYATINPSGPTVTTDLTTKSYVDAKTYSQLINGSYNLTLNADGTVQFPGYKFPAADGTANQVLKTDGAGVLSWYSPSDFNTTYTQNISATTGGANLNLVGSDLTTDTVKFADGTGVTVSYTDASTATIAIGQSVATTDDVTFNSVTTANVYGGGSNLTLTGGSLIANNIVVGNSIVSSLSSGSIGGDTATLTLDSGALTWNHVKGALVPSSVDGTWSLNADGTTSLPNYTFPYADGTANQVLKTDGAGVLSWYTPVDTNTTYTYAASAATGGANLTLTGSDSSVNTVKVSSGTGVTVSDVSSTEISVAIGQDVSTTANTTFGSVSANGATVGASARQFSTTSGNLTLNTANGATSGSLVIAAGANGDITLTPNGTGNAAFTMSNGGNITNTRNYVFGAIRDATTQANGDEWSFSSGAGTGYRGVTIDNSALTTKRPGVVLRSYSASGAATSPRMGLINEGSRGTPASPTALQQFDFMGEWLGTGRTSTGWVSDLVSATPAGSTFVATENWTGLTNVGAGWILALQPTATTLTAAGASRISVIDASPQQYAQRADSWAVSSGKTTSFVATGCSISGTTLTIGTVTFGSIAVGASLQTTTGAFMSTYITANISGSGSGSTWTLSQSQTTASGLTVVGYKGAIGYAPGISTVDILQPMKLYSGTVTSRDGTLTYNNNSGTNMITMTSGGKFTVTDPTSSTTAARNFLQLDNPTNNVSDDNMTLTLQLTNSNGAGAASEQPVFNFTNYRYNTGGSVYVPTQSGDALGGFKFNGQYSSTGTSSIGMPTQIQAVATENWTSTAQGTKVNFVVNQKGTTTGLTAISAASDATTFQSDSFYLKNSGGTQITGNNINYNRVYGQWQYDTTVTPAAANTAYAYPIASGTTDFANIASVGNTSHIIPGALGMYKLQFSVQLDNADNGSDHIAYFWWRKNGTDVPGSMGQVGVYKGGQTIAGWDNMIQVTNTSDYWELMYAVDDTNITLPYYGTTAFGPATASMFITLVPVGA